MSTQPPPAEETAIVRREPRAVEAFDAENPVAMYLNTALFEQVQRVATMMSRASLVPAHLRGADKLSDCFLIVGQAFRWGMDPFAVAQHTYVLSGKLGYEGKLVAAVLNTSGRLVRPLAYTYTGEKGTAARSVTVTGTLLGEAVARSIEGTVGDWQTANQQWKQNTDQMLAYRGAREWARRHMPEAVLGVQTDEEIIDIPSAPAAHAFPPAEPVVDRMAAATAKLQAASPKPEPVEPVEPAKAAAAPADAEKPAAPVQNPDADDAPEAEPARLMPLTPRERPKQSPKQTPLLEEEPAFLRAQVRAARAAQGER